MFLKVNLKLWEFVTAFLIVIFGAFVLSGCTSTTDRDPKLLEALRIAKVTEVRVEATPDVATGFPMLNGITPQQQVAMVVAALQKRASHHLKGYPGGSVPARLVITLQRADLASTPGRILNGNDSWIEGTVRLEDIHSGKLIAQTPNIRGEDHGVKGSGNIGVFIAIAANAVTTKSQDALADKLAASLTTNIKSWLTAKTMPSQAFIKSYKF